MLYTEHNVVVPFLWKQLIVRRADFRKRYVRHQTTGLVYDYKVLTSYSGEFDIKTSDIVYDIVTREPVMFSNASEAVVFVADDLDKELREVFGISVEGLLKQLSAFEIHPKHFETMKNYVQDVQNLEVLEGDPSYVEI